MNPIDAVPGSPTPVQVGSLAGYVFHAERVEALCFVPAVLVAFGPSGAAWIDLLGYVRAGWSQRNARWSDSAGGAQHLFPDRLRLVTGTASDAASQIKRWHHFAGAERLD